MQKSKETKTSAIIRFCGDSGDGMQLTGSQFTATTAIFGNDLATFPDYPAEIRAPAGTLAGVSGFQLNFSSEDIHTPGDSPDVLIAMNPAALKTNIKDLKIGGILITNSDAFTEKDLEKAGYKETPITDELKKKYQVFEVQINKLTSLALEKLNMSEKEVDRTKNLFALGMTYWMFSRPMLNTEKWLEEKFKGQDQVIQANLLALRAGYNYADTAEVFVSQFEVPKAKLAKGTYRNITGNSATAIGLVTAAHKANLPLFLGSYPITPASDILHELSKFKNYDVKTLQCEDEIAGVASAIGASFAGNLAVTTTSGPGLCLKSEAINLAIMTELPLVIVNVQRGGPSTGLPTKTEQSDLLQSIYGRNGESPIPVLAADTPADCFETAYEAVRVALQFMTPIILLTDGYLANGSEPWKLPNLENLPEIKSNLIQSPNHPSGKYMSYQRHEDTLARDWAVPGVPGLEHRIGGLEKDSLSGAVSYDPDNHEKMVWMRAKKIKNIENFIPEQEIFGEKSGDILIIGWGSTQGSIRSAVEKSQKEGVKVSHAQIRWLNPFPKNLESIMKNFRHILVPELNTGQLAFLLQGTFGVRVEKLNKIKGKPFTINEIQEKIEEILRSLKG
ncbi:MAG: 2-oxoacid:acceptor oxidoreductase subunit alpha [Leptospiraceae bacterium]|nr:2-oxoacid:acceptor oxidoreductase subunit alpha [Leptospiraceae bacterium]MCK6379698.1 2-oxoacid:acceptor oxidoreductase subunit alpha [Leptospiraceae bacterium]